MCIWIIMDALDRNCCDSFLSKVYKTCNGTCIGWWPIRLGTRWIEQFGLVRFDSTNSTKSFFFNFYLDIDRFASVRYSTKAIYLATRWYVLIWGGSKMISKNRIELIQLHTDSAWCGMNRPFGPIKQIIVWPRHYREQLRYVVHDASKEFSRHASKWSQVSLDKRQELARIYVQLSRSSL